VDKVIIVSGSCPKCGHVESGKLEKANDRFKALCPKHGRQTFKILSSAIRDKEEAEQLLKGVLH
jgi:hypothetical protein